MKSKYFENLSFDPSVKQKLFKIIKTAQFITLLKILHKSNIFLKFVIRFECEAEAIENDQNLVEAEYFEIR